MNSLAAEIVQRQSFGLQALANISWAYASLGMLDVTLATHLLMVAERLSNSATVQDADSLLGLLWPTGVGPKITLPIMVRPCLLSQIGCASWAGIWMRAEARLRKLQGDHRTEPESSTWHSSKRKELEMQV